MPVSRSSNLCGEEGLENVDQYARYRAASQILSIKFGKTSPSELFPGTPTLCRFRRARRKSWPQCREKQSLSSCSPNHEGSSPLRLFCLRLHRRVPAPRWGPENRPTSQLPSGTPRSLPEACPCLRNRRQEYSAETNPWGQKAALSGLNQSD